MDGSYGRASVKAAAREVASESQSHADAEMPHAREPGGIDEGVGPLVVMSQPGPSHEVLVDVSDGELGAPAA
ncbi:MAG: hypothetical protein C4305_04825 [Thermoleophilia bacterium]